MIDVDILSAFTCLIAFFFIVYYYVFHYTLDFYVTIEIYDWVTPGFLEEYCEKNGKQLTRLTHEKYKIHSLSLYDKFYLARKFVKFIEAEDVRRDIDKSKEGLSLDIKLVSN